MVADQFNIWNAALQTGDPNKVASLYAPDGVLLPTVSNVVRKDHAAKVCAIFDFACTTCVPSLLRGCGGAYACIAGWASPLLQ